MGNVFCNTLISHFVEVLALLLAKFSIANDETLFVIQMGKLDDNDKVKFD